MTTTVITVEHDDYVHYVTLGGTLARLDGVTDVEFDGPYSATQKLTEGFAEIDGDDVLTDEQLLLIRTSLDDFYSVIENSTADGEKLL